MIAAIMEAPDTTALRARFRGALLRPGEEGYDEARRVWNGAIDRQPALIARCAGADDVVEALRFARERELPVSVRGGGHAVAGHAVCDGGVMIDLSLMKSVHVDPQARTARAAGGLLWRELDAATQQHGLATTGSLSASTRRRSPSAVTSSTASRLSTVSPCRRMRWPKPPPSVSPPIPVWLMMPPELFWGVRGGGGNFGVATAFEYRLHPVGPLVLGGPMFWGLDDAPAVLRALRELAPAAPDELGISISIMPAPPLPFLAPEQFGKPVIGLVLAWAGDAAAGERAIAPLRKVGRPLADVVRPIPYLALQSMLDDGAPHGRHYYWKAQRLPALSDATIEVFHERASAFTSPFAQINGWAVGGAVGRVDPHATAVGERETGFEISLAVGWSPFDADGDRHRTWARDGSDALQRESAGIYANFISDEGSAGVEAAYGARLARLTALKDRYDPANVFRHNANIPPSEEVSR